MLLLSLNCSSQRTSCKSCFFGRLKSSPAPVSCRRHSAGTILCFESQPAYKSLYPPSSLVCSEISFPSHGQSLKRFRWLASGLSEVSLRSQLVAAWCAAVCTADQEFRLYFGGFLVEALVMKDWSQPWDAFGLILEMWRPLSIHLGLLSSLLGSWTRPPI